MKNNVFNQILPLSLVAVIMGACSPLYYSPNTQNVPMLKEKGEVAVNVTGNTTRFELQGAYAVSDNQAAMFNLGVFPRKGSTTANGGSGNFIEGGYGYYKPLSNDWRFETFGLLGFGSLENHFPSTVTSHPNTDGKITANLFKIGIQPAIGYNHKNFNFIISTRLSSLNYSNIQGNLFYNGMNQQSFLESAKSNLLFEPAITLRAGGENIKFQAQYIWSYNMTRGDLNMNKNVLTLGFAMKFK